MYAFEKYNIISPLHIKTGQKVLLMTGTHAFYHIFLDFIFIECAYFLGFSPFFLSFLVARFKFHGCLYIGQERLETCLCAYVHMHSLYFLYMSICLYVQMFIWTEVKKCVTCFANVYVDYPSSNNFCQCTYTLLYVFQ